MKAKTIPQNAKLIDDGGPVEAGYAAWKSARVVRAQAQTADRSKMIEADKVWKQLGCDD